MSVKYISKQPHWMHHYCNTSAQLFDLGMDAIDRLCYKMGNHSTSWKWPHRSYLHSKSYIWKCIALNSPVVKRNHKTIVVHLWCHLLMQGQLRHHRRTRPRKPQFHGIWTLKQSGRNDLNRRQTWNGARTRIAPHWTQKDMWNLLRHTHTKTLRLFETTALM